VVARVSVEAHWIRPLSPALEEETMSETITDLRQRIADQDAEILRLRACIRCYRCRADGKEPSRSEKLFVCEMHFGAAVIEAMKPYHAPDGAERESVGVA
jgi:hypothetical protein